MSSDAATAACHALLWWTEVHASSADASACGNRRMPQSLCAAVAAALAVANSAPEEHHAELA
eukprot:scaffold23787_cov73-Phaeocystis_antarctica.AAC.4